MVGRNNRKILETIETIGTVDSLSNLQCFISDEEYWERERRQLDHLDSVHAVNAALRAEKKKLVILRFGHDEDPACMQMDLMLTRVRIRMYSSVVVYLVDTKKVPYYNEMFDLVDPCTIMFFYHKKLIKLELSELDTGEHIKITKAIDDIQELRDIAERAYTRARRRGGLAVI